MRPSNDAIRATVERVGSLDERSATRAIIHTFMPPAPRPIDTTGRQARRASLRESTGSTAEADRRLERIIDGNELTDLNYLSLGLLAARSVCRIVVRTAGVTTGHATGFLAAPGVLITNEHVFPDAGTAGGSVVQFQYELDARGNELTPVEFALSTDTAPLILPDLDLAVVQVADTATDGTGIDQFGWLRLDPSPGKSPEGEFLTIVQHPGGARKQLCVRENKLLDYDADGIHLTYTSDTVAGSSGSPVFNNSWDVVALHHSGVPATVEKDGRTMWQLVDGTLVPASDDGAIDDDLDLVWVCNEGVRISAIAARLATLAATDPLAARIAEAPRPPLPPAGPWPGPTPEGTDEVAPSANGGGGPRSMRRTDPTTAGVAMIEARRPAAGTTGTAGTSGVVVPLELVIELRTPTGTGATVIGPTPRTVGGGGGGNGDDDGAGLDELARTPASYADRVGYLADFLGPKLPIPLPTVTGTRVGDVVEVVGGGNELRYGTFSVIMSRSRALAFVSAANLDRATKGPSDRSGIPWKNDPRLDPKPSVSRTMQVGEAFYGSQTDVDRPGRDDNPFDRGHLTRFADTNWGQDETRNGEDSFHFPNCAPQHWKFNQDNDANGIWYRLEDWAADLSTSGRLCIFNGPIFDAPASKVVGGVRTLDPKGPRAGDPTFHGSAIPKQFFKIAAYVGADGKLAAQAFIVTQEDVLSTVESLEEALTEAELRLYRVPVKTIATLTGLDFGPLARKSTTVNELATSDIEPITSFDQLTA